MDKVFNLIGLSVWLVLHTVGVSLLSLAFSTTPEVWLLLLGIGLPLVLLTRHMATLYTQLSEGIAEPLAHMEVSLDAMQARWGGGLQGRLLLVGTALLIATVAGVLVAGTWYTPFTDFSAYALVVALGLTVTWGYTLAPWRRTLHAMADATQSVVLESTFDHTTICTTRLLRPSRRITLSAGQLQAWADGARLTFTDGQQRITVPCKGTDQREQMLAHLYQIRRLALTAPFQSVAPPQSLKDLLQTTQDNQDA